MKPKYINIPTSAYKVVKKSISAYYPKELVNSIIKECYCEKYPNLQTNKHSHYSLVYPKGGDDWSLYQNRKTKKWSCGGHGTYFGRIKSKKQALKK